MGQYNPRTVLRQTSNVLLREFFESMSVEFDVEWKEMRETQIEPVFFTMQRLPDEVREPIDLILKEVHLIASSDEGILQLIREGSGDGFAETLEQFDSRYDKAIWTFMNAPDTWDAASRFHEADSLSKRYWHASQCPTLEPDCSEEAVSRLRDLISAFFVEGQGRGHHCQVDHLRRSDGQDYFFVYLSNYVATYQTWSKENELVRRSQRHAFEVIFAYGRTTGVLNTFAQGGKAVREPILERFTTAILGQEIPPDKLGNVIYNLQVLKSPDFRFSTDPMDRVTHVAIQSMQLRANSHRSELIAITRNNDSDQIHELIRDALDQGKVPLHAAEVVRATIKMQIATARRSRTLTFDLTESTSNLKSKPEAMRAIAEKYLPRWGIAPRAETRQEEELAHVA